MKALVLGAGMMGSAMAYDLAHSKGVEKIILADINEDAARAVAVRTAKHVEPRKLDINYFDEVVDLMGGVDVALGATSYTHNVLLTKAAIEAKVHFTDLGGNMDVVDKQLAFDAQARAANVLILPNCGLAPGMACVIAAGGAKKFSDVREIHIRVGGLPQHPQPPLNYQLVFSPEGLINEYWEPVQILENGQEKTVPPMSAVEELEFPGVGKLEAFYTSGGTSTLPQTYQKRVRFLDYKTIRYQGHCAMFRPMLEIGLASREPLAVDGQQVNPRSVFKAVLDKNLTFPGEPDLALVRVAFEGSKNGIAKKVRYEIIDREDPATGLTAMMRTTSFPIAIIAWMASAGKITHRGVVPQEVAVDPDIFMTELSRRGIKLDKYDS